MTELLPADGASYGFDNVAGVLGVSPTLLERYLGAARKISRIAVGRPVPSAATETFRVTNDLSQDDWVAGMPFGTRGGATFRYNFPQDGEYVVRVSLARGTGGQLATFDVPHALEVSLDNDIVLVAGGAEVDGHSDAGFTPLMFAARLGHIDTVDALLDAGADIGYIRISQLTKCADDAGA